MKYFYIQFFILLIYSIRITVCISNNLPVVNSKFHLYKQKVAIIGGNGYIGSRIYNDLHYIYDITLFDRFSLDKNIIQYNANDIPINFVQSFHTIIYLGGYTGRKICDKYPENVHKENVEDILLFSQKMLSNQTLIFASTSAVMEGSGIIKTNENTHVIINNLDLYSKSMYERELIMKKYSENKLLPRLIGLRFGTVVGHSPGQRTDMVYMALLKTAHLYNTMNISNGDSWRAILGLNDLIRALNVIIENPFLDSTNKMDIYHLNSFNIKIKTIAKDIVTWGINAHIYNIDSITTKGFSLSSLKFEKTYNFRFQETSKSIIRELVTFLPDSIIGKGIHTTKMDYFIRPSKHDIDSIPCPVCGHKHPIEVLNLNNQPLANDFKNNLNDSLDTNKYPLRLMTCPKCYHMFLSTVIDRSKLFSKYLYESGTSKTLLSYFEWLAKRIDKDMDIKKSSKTILEIACNDGSQLDIFKKMNWNTYCVDPAESIVQTAERKGHKVFVGFWGTDTFDEIPKFDNLDVILAQNVLAHVAEPVTFLKACANIMGIHTKLYIQTSQCQMHQEGQFDTAYHEHISFFTGHSFQKASQLSGLNIVDFSVTPIHGKSCLVTLMRSSSTSLSSNLHYRLLQEIYDGITSKTFYINYKEHAIKRQKLIISYLLNFLKNGYVLGAYGAAAKGMVLLHFLLYGNSNIKIDFVLDDALLKQNTYCPGTNIPVYQTSFLSTYNDTRPLVIIIFAWNFWEEISNKIRSEITHLNNDRKVIIILPFPHVKVFEL